MNDFEKVAYNFACNTYTLATPNRTTVTSFYDSLLVEFPIKFRESFKIKNRKELEIVLAGIVMERLTEQSHQIKRCIKKLKTDFKVTDNNFEAAMTLINEAYNPTQTTEETI